MSERAPDKRENYTPWIIGLGVLLLLAAGLPFFAKRFAPREFVLELRGPAGKQIVWQAQTELTNHTGVTNLPVNLTFRARTLKFSAYRTNYLGQLELHVWQDGNADSSVTIGDYARGVTFFYDHSESGVTSID